MGIVYVLTNDSMPGIVKIGITDESVNDRMRSLDNTSVPTPFRFYYAIEDKRYKDIEKLVHNAFSDCRIRINREFFKVDPERIVSALKISGGREIKQDDIMIDQDGKVVDEIATLEEAKVKVETYKKRFNFQSYGIPIGAELVFTRNEDIKCIVKDNFSVEYQGQEYSLSGLAKKLFNEMGYNWKAVSGPNFFMYNDVTLYQMYKDSIEESE